MKNLPRQYHYRYEMYPFAGTVRHTYELVGRHGALTFHVTDMRGVGSDVGPEFSSGLETHYRTPPDYMADDPPSHSPCHVLKAPCWHDGTSLYAQESLLPLWTGNNHEEIFSILAVEADKRFSKGGEE